jgi:hypothetical protein
MDCWGLCGCVYPCGRAVGYCFPWENGETETWLCEPGQRPRRLVKQAEPCRNAFSAFVIALEANVATQSNKGVAE